MSDFIVGLTGGIGCGKTTVTNEFAKLKVEVVDADVIARELVKVGSACLDAIVKHFGPQLLLADGRLNRAKLRQIIFDDHRAKQWLDALMHPAIKAQLQAQLKQASSGYCLLSAPLLFENKLESLVDLVVVIDVSEQTQISRTMARDHVTVAQIEKIIKTQISRRLRRQKADIIIDNEVSLAQLKQQILSVHRKLLELSRQKSD